MSNPENLWPDFSKYTVVELPPEHRINVAPFFMLALPPGSGNCVGLEREVVIALGIHAEPTLGDDECLFYDTKDAAAAVACEMMRRRPDLQIFVYDGHGYHAAELPK